MPKYKVGDVAALFPKPSAPKSDTGKKIQSMFEDFYKNSKKFHKHSHVQVEQKKKQINNKVKFSESPRENKMKKRKHAEDDDSLMNSQTAQETHTKQKKAKLDSAHQISNGKTTQEENYFPRNKKKSKYFNAGKENSSAFSKMHFDEGEDESFSNFDSEEQTPSGQKKKKNLYQTETAESNIHGKFKNKFSKKMKKFINSKNQSEDFNITDTSALDESMEEKQSPEKKSKKKKNKKQKKDKILKNDVVAEEMQTGTKDNEVQNDEKPKIKQKTKKNNKSFLSEDSLNQDPETEKFSEEKDESFKVSLGKRKLQKRPVETIERLTRTLFAGNLPVKMTRQELHKLFSPFGSIEACRLRGSVPVKATIPKKVAAIKGEFHAGQKSCIGYVVFKDAKDATEAFLTLNGTLVGDHHIVVNPASSAGQKKTYDEKRSIFIGNLPFDVEDEAIWSAFAAFEVEAVRAIRDPETGAGKGFGYVLFKNIDSKEAALKMEGVEISDREIRIKEVKSNARKPVPSSNNKFNAMRRKAKKMKNKQDGPNSRKSLKKLMNREKRNYQKKKIASIFKKFSI